jgi:hypothetical protein
VGRTLTARHPETKRCGTDVLILFEVTGADTERGFEITCNLWNRDLTGLRPQAKEPRDAAYEP